MSNREEWAGRLLTSLGVPAQRPQVAFVVAWMSKEGMRNVKFNNPLATTQSGYGGTPIPGQVAGVRMYPSADQGLAATLHVISRGSYSANYLPVFTQLKAGNLNAAADALGRSGWCGGPGAPCPGYGSSVLSIANTMLRDENEYRKRAGEQVGGPFGAPLPQGVPANIGPLPFPGPDVDPFSPTDPLGPLGPGIDDLNPFGGPGALFDWASELGELLSNLTSPDFWKRVGVFALGAVLVVGGAVLVLRELAPDAYGSTFGRAKDVATLAATKGVGGAGKAATAAKAAT